MLVCRIIEVLISGTYLTIVEGASLAFYVFTSFPPSCFPSPVSEELVHLVRLHGRSFGRPTKEGTEVS